MLRDVPAVFLLGVAAASVLLGGLVGLSSSPVVGVTVTGLLGAFGLVVVGKGDVDDVRSAGIQRRQRLQLVGIVALLFAPSFAAGATLGVWAKIRTWQSNRVSLSTPWTAANAPTSTMEAVDWLIVADQLRARGFSAETIASLYADHAGRTASQTAGSGTMIQIEASTYKPLSQLFQHVSEPEPLMYPEVLVWGEDHLPDGGVWQ